MVFLTGNTVAMATCSVKSLTDFVCKLKVFKFSNHSFMPPVQCSDSHLSSACKNVISTSATKIKGLKITEENVLRL